MTLLYALFFGAGVAGLTYSFMGRRVGISNTQQIYLVCGIAFVMSTIFFYSILAMIMN